MDKSNLLKLPIEYLIPGHYQPRQLFDKEKLQDLANSIRTQGLLQPILVRPLADCKYEIIAGERRWRAVQLAGLHEVLCLVKNYTDEQVAAISIIENVSREDLNPLEEARAYQRIINEFNYSQEELADLLGLSRSKISNILRLLNLDDRVKDFLMNGELTEGHGKALAALVPQQQFELAQQCIKNGWSVRKLEQEVKAFAKTSKVQAKQIDPNVKRLEQLLADEIGAETRFDFDNKTNKSGWVKIRFSDLDTLSGVLEKLGLQNY